MNKTLIKNTPLFSTLTDKLLTLLYSQNFHPERKQIFEFISESNIFNSEIKHPSKKIKEIKKAAFDLKLKLSEKNIDIKHSVILNLFSQILGFKNWNTYSGLLKVESEKNDTIFLTENLDIIQSLLLSNISNVTDDSTIWNDLIVRTTKLLLPAVIWQSQSEDKKITVDFIIEKMNLENFVDLYNRSETPENIKKNNILPYFETLPNFINDRGEINQFEFRSHISDSYYFILFEKIASLFYR